MDVRLAVVALCVALAASACSGSDKKPTTLPPLTSTPTASAAPSVPPFPATKQGAAEFVRLYYEGARNRAARGDTAQLKQLSAPECDSCLRLIGYFDKQWAQGSLRGALATLSNVATALVSERSADVTFNAAVTAFDELDRTGRVTFHGSATTLGFTAHLVRTGPGWRVARLTRNA